MRDSLQTRWFSAVCFAIVFGFLILPSTSYAKNINDLAIDGLGERELEQPLPRDLWAGLSIEQAINHLNMVSHRFAHPVYKDVLRHLLTAKSEGFYTENNKKQELNNIQAVKWLNLRFNTLFEIGAFEDAQNLYSHIFGKDVPEHPQLILNAINILLSQGKINAACLDINVLGAKTNQNTQLKELKLFCDRYLTDQSDEQHVEGDNDQISLKDKQKDIDPDAPYNPDNYRVIDNFPPFQNFDILPKLLNKNMTLTYEEYRNASITEKFIAYALDRLPALPKTQYEDGQISNEMSAFDIKLYSLLPHTNPDQMCFLNEAFLQSIITADALRMRYEALEFGNDFDDELSMTKRHTQHPCEAPAWYLQWINESKSDEDGQQRSIITFRWLLENNPQLISIFAQNFENYLDVSSLTPQERFVLAQYFIRQNIEFTKIWERHAISFNDDQNKPYIAPEWYFLVLADSDLFEPNHFDIWFETQYKTLPAFHKIDPSSPLTLLKNMSNLTKYQEYEKEHYEKLFSLTFSRNYVKYNNVLISRINTSIENERTGESLLLLLRILSDQAPDDIYIGYLNYLMDIFRRIGYKYYARQIIVDTLSVGKK